jgi:site-specific DNA-methyltransferase (adenine-specific)
MDWTNGVRTFSGQSKKGAGGHPAPFPIELPRRCIKLFSFIDDTALDPFLGSESTLIASYLRMLNNYSLAQFNIKIPKSK